MADEIDKMVHWGLTESLQPDESFKVHPGDGSLEEGEYYGASFLARVGFFNPKARFWTDITLPDAGEIRARILTYVMNHRDSAGSGGSYYESILSDCIKPMITTGWNRKAPEWVHPKKQEPSLWRCKTIISPLLPSFSNYMTFTMISTLSLTSKMIDPTPC